MLNHIDVDKKETKTTVFDLKQLSFWVLSVFFSALPVILDGGDYLLKNGNLDKKFFTLLFTRGDILCIVATLSVMTFVDYLFNEQKPKKLFWKILLVLLLIFWIFIFALWRELYSISQGVYDDNIVRKMTAMFVIPALIISAVLQGGTVIEVEK